MTTAAAPATKAVSPATARATADPKPAIQKLADKNASDTDRLAAIRQLQSAGPAARAATPALAKLIKRIDLLAGGDNLAIEAAAALASIGPDASSAGLVAVRAEMNSAAGATAQATTWNDVLIALGPSIAPALTDSLTDKSDWLARDAAHVLAQWAASSPADKSIAAAITKMPPKILAAWPRANANSTQTPALDPRDQSRLAWRTDLVDLATACGQKTLDQLAQLTDAKLQISNTAANAAVAKFAQAWHATDGQAQYAAGMDLQSQGPATFVPLCHLIATDAQARDAAVGQLGFLFLNPRGSVIESGSLRDRLIALAPPPLLPLDAKSKAEFLKIVPTLSQAAAKCNPSITPRDTEAAPLMALAATAPDVPQVAEALLAALDHVPTFLVATAADALAHCDKSVQAKLDGAAPTTESGKKIIRWAKIRMLPPEQALTAVKSLPTDELSDFVYQMDEACGDDIVPVVLECIGRIKLQPRPPLERRLPKIVMQVLSLLERSDDQSRKVALMLLKDAPLSKADLVKLTPKLNDPTFYEETAQVFRAHSAIARDVLVDQIRHVPETRLRAIDALASCGDFDVTAGAQQKITQAKMDDEAAAFAERLFDADAPVRSAALVALVHLNEKGRPALAQALKAATPEQIKQLASTAAAVKPERDAPLLNTLTPVLQELSKDPDPLVASNSKTMLLASQNADIDQTAGSGTQSQQAVAERINVLAGSDNEADRARAAEQFAALDPSLVTPDLANRIVKLSEDKSAKVRSAMYISAAAGVNEKLDSPYDKVLFKALEDPSKLQGDAHFPVVNAVPVLVNAGSKQLKDAADPDMRAAALLGIEQPREYTVDPQARVPIAIAARAALFPGKHVHRMAIVSLLTADPADPNRQAKGAKALLPATAATDESIAYDADLALVWMYCTNRLTMPDKDGKIAPGGRLIRISDGKDVSQAREASPMEKDYGQVIRATLDQPKPLRLAAIKTMGAKPSDFLGSGWFAFSINLRDTDPQIRAAAFAATAANLATACTENSGAPKQQPQWARIFGNYRTNDQEIRSSLRR